LRGTAAIIQIVEFFLVAWSFALITDEKRFLRIVRFTLAVFAFESVVAMTQLLTVQGYPTGTFRVHQVYAMLTSAGAVMAFSLLTTSKPGRARLLYGILTAILLMGSLLGEERHPWLSLIVAGMMVGFYSGRRKKLLVSLVLLMVTAAALVVSVPRLREMTIARFAEAETSSESQNSLLSRLVLWSIAYKFFESNPVLGVGPKNFISLVPHYATSEEMMGDDALDPHNSWIGVLAEQGLVGFFTYLVLTWALLKLAGLRLRSRMSDLGRSLSLVYLGYMVFWMCMCLPYFMKAEGHIHMMMIGLMAGMYRKYDVMPHNECEDPADDAADPQPGPA
jgi:O-antigen ligase